MYAPDCSGRPPTPWRLLRSGWIDPMLYMVFGAVAFLAHTMADVDRNNRLEEAIGYSASRIALIAFLGMLCWGTVQGLRKQLVVYINDETTPYYNDASATLFIVAGIPLLGFALMMFAYVATALLAPANFESPRYEDFCFPLVGIAWGIGLVWMYARLYAYNRGALSAFVAFVTKLAWCLLAIHFLQQSWSKLTNEDNESVGDALSGFIVNMILFVAAMFIIEGLTYEGPSLRRE